ncbi:MAG: hypothetical protein CMK72_04610 [Pseudomonadaceae bacterium]|nr:hypothetical protein [Pseudomonadaceae bacterium]HCP53928.1 hypothetical protein [Pseudomonas sp.]|tara:strand:+ start:2362 stop:3330 length:969 start_codon:yes stop_codon:yes gene_type:complete
MSKIFVSGASGFVGKSLCQELVSRSYTVHALVRGLQSCDSSVNYHFGSLRDISTYAVALQNVNCVIHLAGRAHVLNDKSIDPLAEFRSVNVQGTLSLAKQAISAGVQRFIFISSIGVNGSHTTGVPFTEDSLSDPHSAYAISKDEAEQGLRNMVQGSDMELVIIRPPLVYAGNAPGNFQRLMKLVAAGIPLPFYSVDNLRSMVALDNLVSFICHCVEHPAAKNQLFLISDGDDMATRQIIYNLAKGMDREIYFWSFPDRLIRLGASLLRMNTIYTQLFASLEIDSNKARSLLDWQPVVSGMDALQKAGGDYLSSNYSNKNKN